jgi:hypothetical protein
VATIESSLEQGDRPSSRLAFSLVVFFRLPSSGSTSFIAGSRSAARRTSQLGSWRAGTLLLCGTAAGFNAQG